MLFHAVDFLYERIKITHHFQTAPFKKSVHKKSSTVIYSLTFSKLPCLITNNELKQNVTTLLWWDMVEAALWCGDAFLQQRRINHCHVLDLHPPLNENSNNTAMRFINRAFFGKSTKSQNYITCVRGDVLSECFSSYNYLAQCKLLGLSLVHK